VISASFSPDPRRPTIATVPFRAVPKSLGKFAAKASIVGFLVSLGLDNG